VRKITPYRPVEKATAAEQAEQICKSLIPEMSGKVAILSLGCFSAAHDRCDGTLKPYDEAPCACLCHRDLSLV
jgi:hypothetical protein